jgi:hypothetical protein
VTGQLADATRSGDFPETDCPLFISFSARSSGGRENQAVRRERERPDETLVAPKAS